MASKHDQSEKDTPGKKEVRKLITVEQKVYILRRYDRGELTAAIHNVLNLLESMLCTIRKDREKITAAVKAGAGSCSTKVSSGQSNIMFCMEKMLVTWTDRRKLQGLNVTFDNTKKAAMDCYTFLKEREMGLVPKFVASTGWFYKFKTSYGFHNVSTRERLRAPTRTPLFPTQIFSGPSSRRRGASPSRCLTWMKRACSGRKCLREKSAPGFKAFKDHFTILPGG